MHVNKKESVCLSDYNKKKYTVSVLKRVKTKVDGCRIKEQILSQINLHFPIHAHVLFFCATQLYLIHVCCCSYRQHKFKCLLQVRMLMYMYGQKENKIETSFYAASQELSIVSNCIDWCRSSILFVFFSCFETEMIE